jgi:hypothetical protein
MPSSAKPAAPVAAAETVTEAPAASATVTTTTSAGGQSSLLDTSLVLAGMAIIAFVLGCLFFVRDIPSASLPIIAGLSGTLLGTVVGGYAAYRWGASDAMKRSTATSQTAPPSA